jgi:N-acetylmuramic acid 6-phosphate etherase
VSTLKTTDYDVKLAILMILTGLDLQAAKAQLDQQNGFLRKAVENNQ